MTDLNQVLLENCGLIESKQAVLRKIEDARMKEKILSFEIEKETNVLKNNGLEEERLILAHKKLVQDCVSNYLLKSENNEKIKENLLMNYKTEMMKRECAQHLKSLKNSFEVLHRLYHETFCSKCISRPLSCPSCN